MSTGDGTSSQRCFSRVKNYHYHPSVFFTDPARHSSTDLTPDGIFSHRFFFLFFLKKKKLKCAQITTQTAVTMGPRQGGFKADSTDTTSTSLGRATLVIFQKLNSLKVIGTRCLLPLGKDIIQLLKMLLKSECCFETTQPIILNPKGGVPGSGLSPLILKNRRGGWRACLDDIPGSLTGSEGKHTTSLLFSLTLRSLLRALHFLSPHAPSHSQTFLRLEVYWQSKV